MRLKIQGVSFFAVAYKTKVSAEVNRFQVIENKAQQAAWALNNYPLPFPAVLVQIGRLRISFDRSGLRFKRKMGGQLPEIARPALVETLLGRRTRPELMSAWVGPPRPELPVVPAALILEQYAPDYSIRDPQLLVLFVGAIDWEPNIDAV
jgi:hypothetical protein